MYSTKLFYAIESGSLEKQMNLFLEIHNNEIDEVINVNITDTKNSYLCCLLYKKA